MKQSGLFRKPLLSRAVVLAFAVSCCGWSYASNVNSTPFERIDYYVAKNQKKQGYPHDSVNNLHSAIFFIPLKPDANGNITADTASSSTFAMEVAGMRDALTPGTKLVLGLGSLTPLVGRPAAQHAFIRNIQKLCDSYGFTGLDLDWEDFNNGNGANHAPGYSEVVKAISYSFHPEGFTISISFATWEAAYIPLAKAVANDVDFLNLQCYFSANNAMNMDTYQRVLADYVKAGFAARRIYVGLPTYAMVDTKKTNTSDKWRSWDQLLAARADVVNRNQWTDPSNGATYYFSGLKLLSAKINYAKSHGFAGIFTWELTYDTQYRNPLSANRLIDETALLTTSPSISR